MGPLSVIDFWSRHAWRAHPLRAAFVLAFLSTALIYVGRFTSPRAARYDMLSLPSESALHDAAIAAAGGDEVKARALLAWPWPQVCSPESDEERLRRAAATVLCLRGTVGHDRVESVVASYLRTSGFSVAALRGVPNITPAASCEPDATFEPYGPDATTCVARVNAEAPYPTSTNATMKVFLQLGLTKGALRDEALAHAYVRPTRGLDLFPGGAEIRRWGRERDGIAEQAALRGELTEPLRLAQLQERALSAFENERRQSASAELAGEQIVGHIGSRLSHTMILGGATALFLLVIVLMWRARAPMRGWRRALITMGMIALGLAYFAPEALSGMRLEEAPRLGSGDEGVLASLFGLLAQLLDVCGAALTALSSAATLERVAMFALFCGLCFAQGWAIAAVSLFGFVVLPYAFATGQPTVLPIDLRAFDSATALPLLSLILGSVATLLAASAARGLWIAMGDKLLERATGVLEASLLRSKEADDTTLGV